MAEGMNSAQLKGKINLVPVLDNAGFKAFRDQLKSGIDVGGGGGGNAPAGQQASNSPMAMMGEVTKGIQGLTGMGGEGGGAGGAGGKAGGVAAIATGALKILEKIFDLFMKFMQIVMESSPLFKSVAKLFSTAMNLLFMPLGNMIARMLMPIMLNYMRRAAERAAKYANSPPTDMEQVTSDAVSDMTNVFIDVLGVILTQVLPPILTGALNGLFNGLSKLFSGQSISSEDYDVSTTDAVTRAQLHYKDVLANSSKYMLTSVEGFTRTIDQFGVSIQTDNNIMGEAVTDTATTFYTGSDTIENGITSSMTVLVYGTTKAIEQLSEMINLNNGKITTTVNSTTDVVTTAGTDLDAALGGAGRSFTEAIDTTKGQISGEGGLLDQLDEVSGGFNILAATIPNVINSLLQAQRDITNDGNGINTKAADWKKTGIASVDLAYKYKTKEDKTILDSANSGQKQFMDQLGIGDASGATLIDFGLGYEVVDEKGKVLSSGLYSDASYLYVKQKSAFGSGLGSTVASAMPWYPSDDKMMSAYYLLDQKTGHGAKTDVYNAIQSGMLETSTDSTNPTLGANTSTSSALTGMTGYVKNNNNVNVTVQGSVVSENELKDIVQDQLDDYFSNTKGASY